MSAVNTGMTCNEPDFERKAPKITNKKHSDSNFIKLVTEVVKSGINGTVQHKDITIHIIGGSAIIAVVVAPRVIPFNYCYQVKHAINESKLVTLTRQGQNEPEIIDKTTIKTANDVERLLLQSQESSKLSLPIIISHESNKVVIPSLTSQQMGCVTLLHDKIKTCTITYYQHNNKWMYKSVYKSSLIHLEAIIAHETSKAVDHYLDEMDSLTKALLSGGFANYKVLDKIGGGKQGVIYKVTPPPITPGAEHPIALKLLANDDINLIFDPREIDIMSRLSHPNVMSMKNLLINLPADNCNQSGYTMELASISLDNHLKKSYTEYNFNNRLQHIYQLALGLNYVHRSGIAHLDLHMTNTMVMPDNSVKIIDFGLAQYIDPRNPNEICTRYPKGYYYNKHELDGKVHGIASDVMQMGLNFGDILYGKYLGFYSWFDSKDFKSYCAKWLSQEKGQDKHSVKTFLGDNIKEYTQELPMVVDLLVKMCDPDYSTRITMEEVVKHPLFKRFSSPPVSPSNMDIKSLPSSPQQNTSPSHNNGKSAPASMMISPINDNVIGRIFLKYAIALDIKIHHFFLAVDILHRSYGKLNVTVGELILSVLAITGLLMDDEVTDYEWSSDGPKVTLPGLPDTTEEDEEDDILLHELKLSRVNTIVCQLIKLLEGKLYNCDLFFEASSSSQLREATKLALSPTREYLSKYSINVLSPRADIKQTTGVVTNSRSVRYSTLRMANMEASCK